MMKQHEVLRWASLFLRTHDCEEPIAEILLQHHLNVSRNQFFMDMHKQISGDVIERFQIDIKHHVKTGIPVEHLTGQAAFYGRSFFVNEQTLIPRPETEELIQYVLMDLKKTAPEKPPVLIDVGTGTGIIAITLKLEYPEAQVYATDISKSALQMAQKNAATLQADVTFLQGDFLQPVISETIQPDVIISNPPYISETEKPTMSRTVKDFDPDLALFAADEGLAAYKHILAQTTKMRLENCHLIFEIGYKQGLAVQRLIQKSYNDSDINIIQDINGKDRIVVAQRLNNKA